MDRRFIARNNRKALLQLRPRLSEELDRLDPSEPVRGNGEPLGFVGGGHLEREDVRARHITSVDAQRRSARGRIVPTDGTTWLAADEGVDVPIRACRGRAVDLASAERAVDVGRVDGGQVQLWVRALVVAHGEIGESLRGGVDVYGGRAGSERVFDRQRARICQSWPKEIAKSQKSRIFCRVER